MRTFERKKKKEKQTKSNTLGQSQNLSNHNGAEGKAQGQTQVQGRVCALRPQRRPHSADLVFWSTWGWRCSDDLS